MEISRRHLFLTLPLSFDGGSLGDAYWSYEAHHPRGRGTVERDWWILLIWLFCVCLFSMDICIGSTRSKYYQTQDFTFSELSFRWLTKKIWKCHKMVLLEGRHISREMLSWVVDHSCGSALGSPEVSMVPSEGCALRAKGMPPDYSLSAATLISAPSHLDETVTLCGPEPWECTSGSWNLCACHPCSNTMLTILPVWEKDH